jgi:hypothetical protein
MWCQVAPNDRCVPTSLTGHGMAGQSSALCGPTHRAAAPQALGTASVAPIARCRRAVIRCRSRIQGVFGNDYDKQQ